MCRWFAYIAPTEECLLEDVLVTPVRTLWSCQKLIGNSIAFVSLDGWVANSAQAHALSKQVNEHYLPKLISHDGYATKDEVKTRNYFNNVHEGTDSEHLAALYITCLTNNGGPQTWEQQYPAREMAAALKQAIQVVITLQQKVLGVKNAEANSLNVACTDGQQLVAFRVRNHQAEQPPSLYWSNTAGVTLNRKYPDHP